MSCNYHVTIGFGFVIEHDGGDDYYESARKFKLKDALESDDNIAFFLEETCLNVDGYIKGPIELKLAEITQVQRERLSSFCQEVGLPEQEPKWLLVGAWY